MALIFKKATSMLITPLAVASSFALIDGVVESLTPIGYGADDLSSKQIGISWRLRWSHEVKHDL